ncbi:hypothetical protein [Paenibacillus sp. NEAU-GSW1]|uniref:hypothetical protein n=1 Tax=Paenibacillus sp. NEAU-GSW1 TaxID=2682486 RepID=UPI0012E1AE56|nr:hypothetical protein [Paenibacillus sp. NEAU-GSW1]MUT66009.1 hypothetical protein [Paenibacillus sp. NEAU-GSW1]
MTMIYEPIQVARLNTLRMNTFNTTTSLFTATTTPTSVFVLEVQGGGVITDFSLLAGGTGVTLLTTIKIDEFTYTLGQFVTDRQWRRFLTAAIFANASANDNRAIQFSGPFLFKRIEVLLATVSGTSANASVTCNIVYSTRR